MRVCGEFLPGSFPFPVSNRVIYPHTRAAAMSAPAFQCEGRGLAVLECRSSRDIRYIFLESCRNIPACPGPQGPVFCPPTAQHHLSTDEDCDSSSPARHLPAALGSSARPEVEAVDVRGSPEGKKRLPVFRQLCGEAVEELEELPEAQEAPGNAKGWRMVRAGACPACDKA